MVGRSGEAKDEAFLASRPRGLPLADFPFDRCKCVELRSLALLQTLAVKLMGMPRTLAFWL